MVPGDIADSFLSFNLVGLIEDTYLEQIKNKRPYVCQKTSTTSYMFVVTLFSNVSSESCLNDSSYWLLFSKAERLGESRSESVCPNKSTNLQGKSKF